MAGRAAGLLVAGVLVACGGKERAPAVRTDTASATAASDPLCPPGNGGLTLPPGFCATVFADSIGHARHIAVAPNGVVYVNTWSGRYYDDRNPPQGGFLVALRDTTGDGRADVIARFGATESSGGAGGTGIALHGGFLYAEESDRIERYAMPASGIVPDGKPDVIVSGLPLTGDHPMHPFAIDSANDLFVDLGSASNSCQVKNRTLHSPGHKPCTELETRGGIWRYDAARTGQRFSPAGRYATGIRNAVGIAIAPNGQLYSTQHGRDQLAENWPQFYKPEQGANLPAEELLEIVKGGDYGWPYCYFDDTKQSLMLAPEYGGNGTTVGLCASKRAPAAFFPAHWAPDDLLFYTGTTFPARYRGGAFIAFHGSWNRAPFPQGGYQVAFVPFDNGHPTGTFGTFADGFAGAVKDPARAAHRPAGLAQGPDGSLYVTDDVHGTVWRITYHGTAR